MTQIFVAQESSAGDAKTVAGPMPTPETYLLGLSLAVRDRASAISAASTPSLRCVLSTRDETTRYGAIEVGLDGVRLWTPI